MTARAIPDDLLRDELVRLIVDVEQKESNRERIFNNLMKELTHLKIQLESELDQLKLSKKERLKVGE